ncbi:M35 family metallo-endopeptidase [Roseicyclus sp. F158]|uniref:M35 family metallo-endopeptidase n=1 Tax=Tropicimonas omnivorans TaxID=3075590 RepID=A0ABU3DBV7_9RHOB|nr:M35 family metallo-endopeptidase [Roseicyclus sp. F158]MDT0681204.1 M35 family metallo-endopeptidase [Roseicyclus sp. F158]
MPMRTFTQSYSRARRTINSSTFKDATADYFDKPVAGVLASDGPDRKYGPALDVYRLFLSIRRMRDGSKEGDILVDDALGSKPKSLGDAVATLKKLRHLYMVHLRGGQELWMFSPPKAYTEWLFDEYTGVTEKNLRIWANEAEEVYTSDHKGKMATATSQALRWSQSCVAKLAVPDAKTRAVIERWFTDGTASDEDVKKIAASLLAGFKKISAVLNSNKLIFSDEPVDRNGGGWKDFAFVISSEKMNVVYIQKATLDAAVNGKMWLAALTIIHELSHREINTDDHRYDTSGKLSPSAGKLTPAKALDNADNWGYFATDLNGGLAAGTRTTVAGVA